MDSILQTSNLGARLFELGRLEEAKCHFQHALKALKRHHHANLVLQQQLQGAEKNKRPPLTDCHAIRGWTVPTMEQEHLEHIFCFSRAFYLDPNFDASQLPVYFCCMTFNLGVTYHLLTWKRTKASDFRQSSYLYEQSMKTIESDVLPESSCFVYDLRMVILNNAGHIYYTERCNIPAATQCFEAVCGIVGRSSSGGSLPDPEVDNMLANVLLKFSVTAPVA